MAENIRRRKSDLRQSLVRRRRFRDNASSKWCASSLSSCSRTPRVAFQSVHRRRSNAQPPRRRDFFQLQRFFVQRLQQFLRGLEKKLRSSAPRSSGESVTLAPQSLISRSTIAMHQSGFIGHPAGFPRGLQISSRGIQAAVKLFDQPLLFRLVEVHHHVAAENNVVALRQIFGFQVMKVEVNHLLSAFFTRNAPRPYRNTANGIRNPRCSSGGRCKRLPARTQHRIADIAGQYFHRHGGGISGLGNTMSTAADCAGSNTP